MLSYHVEYMSRPDERDHVVPVASYEKGIALARKMSDAHDTLAYLIACEERDDEDGDKQVVPVGQVSYWSGTRDGVEGRVK